MKSIIRVGVFFSTSLLFIINQVFSQLQVEWENRYDGVSSFIDNPASIVVDNQDNVYVAGNTFVNNTTNGYDAIIIKYENDGTKIWQTTYSHGQKNDKIFNIIIINDFIYLTCTYFNKLILLKYNTNGDFISESILKTGSSYYFVNTKYVNGNLYIKTSYTENYETEMFDLIKCDLTGNIIWAYNYEPNTIVLPICVDNEGNIILAGSKNYMFSPVSYAYVGDALLLKISQDGNVIWEADIENNPNPESLEMINKLAIDNQNNIYTITNYDNISKFNDAGVLLWDNQFIHPEFDGNTIKSISTNEQKIYLNGYSWTGGGKPNILTICYNPNGIVDWYDNYFTDPNYSASNTSSLNIDNNGNIYSSGYSHAVGGKHNVYMKAYTSNGVDIFDYSYNSTGNANESLKLVVLKNDKIYLLTKSDNDILTIKLDWPPINRTKLI